MCAAPNCKQFKYPFSTLGTGTGTGTETGNWPISCQGFHFISMLSSISMLFFVVDETDFVSYADDNAPFVSGDRLDDVLHSL